MVVGKLPRVRASRAAGPVGWELRWQVYLVKRNLHRALDVPLAEVDGVLHELHLRGVPEQDTGRSCATDWLPTSEKYGKICGCMMSSAKANITRKSQPSDNGARLSTNPVPRSTQHVCFVGLGLGLGL